YPSTDASAAKGALWKLGANGAVLWEQLYQPNGATASWNGVATTASNVFVAGSTKAGSGPEDAIFAKYGDDGTCLWTQTWGGSGSDIAWGIACDASKVYVVGETSSYGAGGKDVFLVVADQATGNVLSTTYFGGSNDEIARSVSVVGPDIYIVGEARQLN